LSTLPHHPTASPDGEQLRATRVFLRPIANPFALGFLGLGVATLLTSGLELGWIGASERTQAALLIIAFAPPLQMVACVFGFLARDAVAATALGIQSASWLSIGLSLLLTRPGGHSHALALLLFVSGTGLLASANTAAQSRLLPAFLVGLTALRFILTGVYELGAGSGWQHAAAWTGVALCAGAVYGMLSLETEDVRRETVLPTLRRGRAKRALEPSLAEQVREVAAEAGVRNQL
jgi:succinate-acetate transporter protein